MWRLVSALTLVGATLVSALPAAQQDDGSLGALIDEVYPQGTTVAPPSVPQVDGDLDDLIGSVFPTTPNSSTLILGSRNTTPKTKPDDCECVPYYQCKDGTILTDGTGIIDIRSDFDDKDKKG